MDRRKCCAGNFLGIIMPSPYFFLASTDFERSVCSEKSHSTFLWQNLHNFGLNSVSINFYTFGMWKKVTPKDEIKIEIPQKFPVSSINSVLFNGIFTVLRPILCELSELYNVSGSHVAKTKARKIKQKLSMQLCILPAHYSVHPCNFIQVHVIYFLFSLSLALSFVCTDSRSPDQSDGRRYGRRRRHSRSRSRSRFEWIY